MNMSTTFGTADIAVLSALARERPLRIAVVESLTSGTLAHTIGAGDGASEWFAGGIIAYMQDVKESLLDVTPGADPCSPQCAEQLAAGGRELFGADVCVATTGVGGPEPEDGHPPGTVYLGWAIEGEHGHSMLELSGSPEKVIDATVTAAMNLILEHGRRVPSSGGGARHVDHLP